MKTRSSAAPDSAGSNLGNHMADKAIAAELPQKPLRTLILPSNASDDARFVTLENPSTGKGNSYYFCPKAGLYEFTLISPPRSAARSILFTPPGHISYPHKACPPQQESRKAIDADSKVADSDQLLPNGNGYVSKVAQLHVATPMDILFFIVPILAPTSKRNQAKKLFQPLDDILDAQEDLSKALRNILLHEKFRAQVERRMAAICDTVDAGETMYRLSMDNLAKELVSKAENVAANGLPRSLEERFVRRELEPPLLSVSRENTSASSFVEESGLETGSAEGDGSQESNGTTSTTTTSASSTSMPSSTSTPATPATPATQQDSQNDVAGKPDIPKLLRVRIALSFILSSYFPPHLSAEVENILKSPASPVDFTRLTEHLKHIAELRAKAQEARAMYDVTSKRGLEDEDGAAEAREEKRRKEEEEKKKRKASESRAVRDLKKVDTSGMKTLNAFFGKPPAKK